MAARIPALAPPLIATVATGIPVGICTIEYNESLPPSDVVCIGIPITGIGKIAAHIPGRCAAIPAPAIITLNPFSSALLAYSKNTSGSLCAEIIVISYEIPNCSRMSAAFAITGISESLPITIPTKAILTSYVR